MKTALRFYSPSLEYDKSLDCRLGGPGANAGATGQSTPRPNCGPAKPFGNVSRQRRTAGRPGTARGVPHRRSAPGPARLATGAMGAAGRSAAFAGRCGENGCWPAGRSSRNIASPEAQEIDGNWLVAMESDPDLSALDQIYQPGGDAGAAGHGTGTGRVSSRNGSCTARPKPSLGLRHAAIESLDQCLQLCPRHVGRSSWGTPAAN